MSTCSKDHSLVLSVKDHICSGSAQCTRRRMEKAGWSTFGLSRSASTASETVTGHLCVLREIAALPLVVIRSTTQLFTCISLVGEDRYRLTGIIVVMVVRARRTLKVGTKGLQMAKSLVMVRRRMRRMSL